jgi:hypothetical protein
MVVSLFVLLDSVTELPGPPYPHGKDPRDDCSIIEKRKVKMPSCKESNCEDEIPDYMT